MKNWFPFTDYDFYGYMTSGLVFLFAIDYWYSGGSLISRDHWTFLQATVVMALAYVTGQMISMPASVLLETGVARTLLAPPIVVLMSNKPSKFVWFISKFFIGRSYTPLPTATRGKILDRAEKDTGLTRATLIAQPEEVFVPAHYCARQVDDTRKRIDDFRNQYGFNRNMAMTGFIATALLLDRAISLDPADYSWALLALLLSVGMLARFLKFYSCFAAEVLRAYAYQAEGP